jgi:hypothetical protein
MLSDVRPQECHFIEQEYGNMLAAGLSYKTNKL